MQEWGVCVVGDGVSFDFMQLAKTFRATTTHILTVRRMQLFFPHDLAREVASGRRLTRTRLEAAKVFCPVVKIIPIHGIVSTE